MEPTAEVELEEPGVAQTEADGRESAAADRTVDEPIKGKIKFESVMQRSEAVAYFGALVDGLKHGQLQFRHGEERLSLAPSEQVVVEIRATRKGNREKVSFELEWKRNTDDTFGLSG